MFTRLPCAWYRRVGGLFSLLRLPFDSRSIPLPRRTLNRVNG